jgi:hypothetical protein
MPRQTCVVCGEALSQGARTGYCGQCRRYRNSPTMAGDRVDLTSQVSGPQDPCEILCTLNLPTPPEGADNREVADHWHHVCGEYLTVALIAAVRCGEALIAQREQMRSQTTRGGTGFTDWLETLPFSRSRAYVYMRIAEHRHMLADYLDSLRRGESPSIRGALQYLDAPDGEPNQQDEEPRPSSGGRSCSARRTTSSAQEPNPLQSERSIWMRYVLIDPPSGRRPCGPRV